MVAKSMACLHDAIVEGEEDVADMVMTAQDCICCVDFVFSVEFSMGAALFLQMLCGEKASGWVWLFTKLCK